MKHRGPSKCNYLTLLFRIAMRVTKRWIVKVKTTDPSKSNLHCAFAWPCYKIWKGNNLGAFCKLMNDGWVHAHWHQSTCAGDSPSAQPGLVDEVGDGDTRQGKPERGGSRVGKGKGTGPPGVWRGWGRDGLVRWGAIKPIIQPLPLSGWPGSFQLTACFGKQSFHPPWVTVRQWGVLRSSEMTPAKMLRGYSGAKVIFLPLSSTGWSRGNRAPSSHYMLPPTDSPSDTIHLKSNGANQSWHFWMSTHTRTHTHTHARTRTHTHKYKIC